MLKLAKPDSTATPTIDLLLVTYNARSWLPGFLSSFAASDYPPDKVRLVVVDNASRDDGIAYIREQAKTLPFQVEIIANEKNLGFAGGYEVAFAAATADYWFVINQDTEVLDNALTQLIDVMEADPKIGIAEARQAPREHPKYYDPFTRETSWCSGACVMVRREAAQQVGGFDPKFFMYAEDVDLSWRMWRHGWKCVYVSDAVVRHFTQDLDPYRNMVKPHYYSMRNGAIMRMVYGTFGEAVRHFLAMIMVVFRQNHPMWHRLATLSGMFGAIRHIPFALKKRFGLRHLPRHPMVSFNGWEYGRHLVDLAEIGPAETIDPHASDRIIVSFRDFRNKVIEESRTRAWLDVEMTDSVGTDPKLAFLTWNTEFSVNVMLPANTVLHGTLGQPKECGGHEGIFSVEADSKVVLRTKVCRARPGEADWIPFSVELPATTTATPTRITLRHMSTGGDCWGFWSDLHIVRQVEPVASKPTKPKISIVVPTYNRANGVGGVLQRLLSQSLRPANYELLVIDNASTDNTQEQLAQFKDHPQFRAFYCGTKGAAAARNVGLNNARGDLIVMMDDDILVRRDFLSTMWRHHMEDQSRILLTKIMHPFDGLVDPFTRFLLGANEVNLYDFPDPNNVPPEFFYTGCVAVPKAVIGKTRFDEQFKVYGVEDIDFGVELLRTGVRMAYVSDVEVWHDYYPKFEYLRRKKGHAGFSLGYYLSKRPWRRHRHVFSQQVVRNNRLANLRNRALRPIARVLEFYEASRYQPGQVNSWLARWYRQAMHLSMYAGMCEYFRSKGNAAGLPDLGYRGANGANVESSPGENVRKAA